MIELRRLTQQVYRVEEGELGLSHYGRGNAYLFFFWTSENWCIGVTR